MEPSGANFQQNTVMLPQQQTVPQNVVRHASLNPFSHIARGAKNFLATNAVPALLVSLISVAFSYILSFLISPLIEPIVPELTAHRSEARQIILGSIGQLVIAGSIFIVASLLAGVFFYQSSTRLVLAGSRKQKISLSEVLHFSFQRFGLSIRTYLLLAIACIVGYLLMIILLATALPIGLLFGLAFVVMVIIAMFELSYLSLVMMDDDKPSGTRGAIIGSMQTWRTSRGATVLIDLVFFAAAIVLFFMFIIFSAIISSIAGFGSATTSTTIQSASVISPSAIITDLLSIIVTSLGTVFIVLPLFAGSADIYNEVHSETNALAPTSAAPAPPQLYPQNTPLPTQPQ